MLGTSSEYPGQVRISRSWGQGQGHKSKKAKYMSVTINTFIGCSPSFEGQSFIYIFVIYNTTFHSILWIFIKLLSSPSLHRTHDRMLRGICDSGQFAKRVGRFGGVSIGVRLGVRVRVIVRVRVRLRSEIF